MQAIRDFYVAAGVVVTGDVVLSAGVNLWYGTIIRGDLARITLGPRVNIQDGCIIHTDHGDPQVIEEGVVVGHRAVLHGRRIGRDTLIGMGALLLSGCEIGEECLIAAGTLVTEGAAHSAALGGHGRAGQGGPRNHRRGAGADAAHRGGVSGIGAALCARNVSAAVGHLIAVVDHRRQGVFGSGPSFPPSFSAVSSAPAVSRVARPVSVRCRNQPACPSFL